MLHVHNENFILTHILSQECITLFLGTRTIEGHQNDENIFNGVDDVLTQYSVTNELVV